MPIRGGLANIILTVCFCVFVSRFVATNDLMLELQKDSIKLDEHNKRKGNGEVQNLTLKWQTCSIKICSQTDDCTYFILGQQQRRR
uniref:Uncharacterized protein n=1 Tax=Nothobranchius furzeri TaxID=105023 RepID=A0A8C6KZ43_NOTFU